MYPVRRWILVVEDEKDLRDLIAEELAHEGFSVICCTKVVEAIRMLSNQKFSCILLDMRLETGTGSQVISAIRRDNHNLNYYTPVIVVSGQLSAEIVQQTMRSVSGFFVKPFKVEALIDKVKSICEE